MTGWEQALTLLGGVWLILGLFIDGYAHSEIIDTETEDFFTPWHAIFYSGFLFTAAVIGWMMLRRADRPGIRNWLPPGYALAAVGLVVFAVGGVGDGIWHTIFGVEADIDALLSPTHLVLFTGMLLILTAPLRVFWLDPEARATWNSAGPALVAATLATSLVVFFFTYTFGLGERWPYAMFWDADDESVGEVVSAAIGGGYVSTVLLTVPLLGLLRRTDLPPGGIVVLWTVPVLLHDLAFGGGLDGVFAALVGALAAELLYGLLRRNLARSSAIVVSVTAAMLVLWSTWIGWVALQADWFGWTPELWTGQILMSTLLAGALALVAFPPTGPVDEPALRP